MALSYFPGDGGTHVRAADDARSASHPIFHGIGDVEVLLPRRKAQDSNLAFLLAQQLWPEHLHKKERKKGTQK